MQTEADKEAAEAFRIQKEEQKRQKEQQKSKSRYNDSDVGVRINLEDEEERAYNLAVEESMKEQEANRMKI